MRGVRTFVVVWMVLFFGGIASAQEALIGSISTRNNSVTKVMLQAGCNQGWLAQVVADSRIDPAKLRYLSKGVKVYLRGGACKENPPEQVVGLSKMLLRMDRSLAQSRNLRKELGSLRESLAASDRRVEKLTVEAGEAGNLKVEVATLGKDLARAKQGEKEAIALASKGTSSYVVGGVGFAGLLLGLAISYGVFAWFNKKSVRFPLTMKVQSGGKQYVFALAGARETVRESGVFVGLYKCPLCSAYDVYGKPTGCVAHVETQHPEERVETDIADSLQQAGTRTRRVQA